MLYLNIYFQLSVSFDFKDNTQDALCSLTQFSLVQPDKPFTNRIEHRCHNRVSLPRIVRMYELPARKKKYVLLTGNSLVLIFAASVKRFILFPA